MKYDIVQETIFSPEFGTYESFGIQNENGYKISDISTNREKIEQLIDIINQKQTPENYLFYEIENLLSEI